MDNLEDAVALFSPRGELIFCNKAMNALQPRALDTLPADHPVRQIVERTLAGRKSQGPGRRLSGLRPAPTPPSACCVTPRDRGHRRPLPRRDARRAQHRVPEPGAFHAELLAQAGGARPADGGRRARGEEPAERDDDSPRAAEAEARRGSRSPRRLGADRRPRSPVVGRPAPDVDQARRHHRQGDPAARRGRERVPEVRAARRAEAAAGASRDADLRHSTTSVAPEAERGGTSR